MTKTMTKCALVAAALAAALPAAPALAAVKPLTAAQIDTVLNSNCVRERGRAEDAAGRSGAGRMTYTDWARNFLAAPLDDAEIGRLLDRLEPTLQRGDSDLKAIAEFQYCVIMNKDRYG